MKTISPHINTNHHIVGDMNRNASMSQAEYQRDACEQELYRLRFGIERLLANTEQGDSRNRYQPRNDFVPNSYRTEIDDLTYRKNKSWFERCTPCCRRWRRTRCDDFNDSFISRSPPIRNVDHLFSPTVPDNTNISNLLASKDINNPVYQSLILKILEAKALDCLCAGYSKPNTQPQISNQKTRDDQWDSTSVTSSTLSPTTSYDSSSSVSISSNISNDESISSSRPITPPSYSPSPISIQMPSRSQITPSPISIQTSSRSQITPSPLSSPIKNIGSSILNEGNDSSKLKPKVAIIEDKKLLRPSKSKTKKKASSKRSKSTKKKSSKPKSSKKKPSKPKSSKKKPTSSKKKSKKPSSKSRSKKSKHKKKSEKPKSNNQVYDHESKIIYPSFYERVSENRQSYLHNFFEPMAPVSFNGNRRM